MRHDFFFFVSYVDVVLRPVPAGCCSSVSRRATRQSEESLQDLLPEERLRRSRERNRDHSRRSRERKKAFVEGLKKQVCWLCCGIVPLSRRTRKLRRVF